MGSSEVLGSFKSTSTSHKTNKNKKTWILIRNIINGYCWNENRMLIHSLYATLTTAQQSFYPPSVIDSGLGLGNDVCCRHIWGKVRTRVETDFSPASVYWFKVLDGERERERAWEGQSDSSLILICVKWKHHYKLKDSQSEELSEIFSAENHEISSLHVISPCLLKIQCAQSRSFSDPVCVRASMRVLIVWMKTQHTCSSCLIHRRANTVSRVNV